MADDQYFRGVFVLIVSILLITLVCFTCNMLGVDGSAIIWMMGGMGIVAYFIAVQDWR